MSLAFAPPAFGQVVPDTIPRDTVAVDTLAVRRAAADTVPGDSIAADTVFFNLPETATLPTGGWQGGAWSWDHDQILASGALTLVDLVGTLPGMVALRAGDYGTPLGVTAFGLGGGRIRVFRDGFELVPLGGGTVDLSRVGLGGITRVRLERLPGEIRLELTSYRYDDGRPYSLIEAGTGDLNTNIFRGMFANPTALGGDLALALERLDSRGARGDEPGFDQGTWLRYQLHRENRAGLAVDFRRMTSQSETEAYAANVSRTDFMVRGSARVVDSLTAEVYWGRSSHTVDDPRDAYATEGGRRSQLGIRASWQKDGLSAEGAWRSFGNVGLPGGDLELRLGGERPGVGGVAADYDRASWQGRGTSAWNVRGWTRPFLGLSVFGSRGSGRYGARVGPLADVVPPADTSTTGTPGDTATAPAPDTTAVALPPYRITDRTTSRLGVQWTGRGVVLSGARLRLEADSLLPLGLQPDRAEPALAGGRRTGWEGWVRVPLPFMQGLYAQGSLQQWDQAWSYLPRRIYSGEIAYHRIFLESGNFELSWRLGVVGHDPMTVRQVVGTELSDTGEPLGPELGAVPFYQSWYGRIQARIVTVQIFLGWDNFTVRRNLQDFPDRPLPFTRAFYGIRWTLWN